MPRRSRSTFVDLAVASLAVVSLTSGRVYAQACCAGTGAVTPARLGTHEDVLVGLQLRGAHHLGSYDAAGAFVPTPDHARELDAEQNLFAAARVLRRVQVSALVPFVETHRAASGRSSTGGGLGDVNLAARWDPLLAGESRAVPGIGLLAGVTLPTGRPAEDATRPMATDATGIGAAQGTLGLSLEQAFGPWFVGLSGLYALRSPRDVHGTRMTLAPQLTALAALGYAFADGSTCAFVASHTVEGEAKVNDAIVPGSARRTTSLSVAGAYAFTDTFRAVGSVFGHPPLAGFGRNQPVTLGVTLGLIWAIS